MDQLPLHRGAFQNAQRTFLGNLSWRIHALNRPVNLVEKPKFCHEEPSGLLPAANTYSHDRSPNCRNVDYSGSGVVARCLSVDNKETNGEFWRSRTACSLEPSSNLITWRGDHRVKMIYHSHSLSSSAAADLDVANFARSRSAKSRTSPGSFLRTKAILRCKSILLESAFS